MLLATGLSLTAERLINKYGSSIVLVEVSNGVYDPVTGETNPDRTEYPTKGVVEAYDTSELVAGTVNRHDLKVITNYQFDVTKKWEVIYKGRTFTVLHIETTEAQDTEIINTLQIRGIA